MVVAESAPVTWPSVVPWFLAALGWIVVNWQNNSREKRKEVRAKIDSIKKSIDDVEDVAVAHHTQAQEDVRCMKVKRVLVGIAREITIVRVAGLKTSDCVKAHSRLRQSITLNNFETRTYKNLPLTDPIIADIGTTADTLRLSLESAYAEKFQKSVCDRLLGK
jgi:hypothetical protein